MGLSCKLTGKFQSIMKKTENQLEAERKAAKEKKRWEKIRNPERLDNFYSQLCEIHKKSFPDMREGQFLLNALGYINSILKRDPFFPESEEMLELFKEYANSNSMWYQGWDLLNK